MIEIEIPKDINNYKPKTVGPFTTRQVICFVLACLVVVPLYLLLKDKVSVDVACISVMVAALPFVCIGWIEPYGMPFEKFLGAAFVCHVLAPSKRKYITVNTFEYIADPEFNLQKASAQRKMMTKKERRKESARKIKTNVKYYV